MRIERQDKQLEPNEEKIQNNWRTWARLNNYMQVNPVFVEVGELSVSLEVWESGEAGLIYLPHIPRAKVEETFSTSPIT